MKIKQTKLNEIQIHIFSEKIQFRGSITKECSTAQATAMVIDRRSYKPTHQVGSGNSVQTPDPNTRKKSHRICNLVCLHI